MFRPTKEQLTHLDNENKEIPLLSGNGLQVKVPKKEDWHLIKQLTYTALSDKCSYIIPGQDENAFLKQIQDRHLVHFIEPTYNEITEFQNSEIHVPYILIKNQQIFAGIVIKLDNSNTESYSDEDEDEDNEIDECIRCKVVSLISRQKDDNSNIILLTSVIQILKTKFGNRLIIQLPKSIVEGEALKGSVAPDAEDIKVYSELGFNQKGKRLELNLVDEAQLNNFDQASKPENPIFTFKDSESKQKIVVNNDALYKLQYLKHDLSRLLNQDIRLIIPTIEHAEELVQLFFFADTDSPDKVISYLKETALNGGMQVVSPQKSYIHYALKDITTNKLLALFIAELRQDEKNTQICEIISLKSKNNQDGDGSLLLMAAMNALKNIGISNFVLSSSHKARGLYRQFGFRLNVEKHKTEGLQIEIDEYMENKAYLEKINEMLDESVDAYFILDLKIDKQRNAFESYPLKLIYNTLNSNMGLEKLSSFLGNTEIRHLLSKKTYQKLIMQAAYESGNTDLSSHLASVKLNQIFRDEFNRISQQPRSNTFQFSNTFISFVPNNNLKKLIEELKKYRPSIDYCAEGDSTPTIDYAHKSQYYTLYDDLLIVDEQFFKKQKI